MTELLFCPNEIEATSLPLGRKDSTKYNNTFQAQIFQVPELLMHCSAFHCDIVEFFFPAVLQGMYTQLYLQVSV
ncbi:hypothetical protein APICC_03006 [Apis cerana cerana]|uniref:Uncharacterized protein n=1 Tax=Apis cerana cerana TaxID=94128 RepID=A0A2A3EDL0_APICC|nr:hypothetical protein APICC_03006 [Apis cerana cerana]